MTKTQMLLGLADGALLGWAPPPKVKLPELPKPFDPATARLLVVFTWSENGLVPEGGLAVDTIEKTRQVLAQWAQVAPKTGAYDKTGFGIELNDDTYEGRLDIQHPDTPDGEPADLLAHMEAFNEWRKGLPGGAEDQWAGAEALITKLRTVEAYERAQAARAKADALADNVVDLMAHKAELEAKVDATRQVVAELARAEGAQRALDEVDEDEAVLQATCVKTREAAQAPTAREREEARLAAVARRHYRGDRYDSKMTMKEVAAKVRKELRADAKVGRGIPKGTKVSVRKSDYAGGCSLYVTFKGPEDRKSPGARAAVEHAEAVAKRYNYDRSDSQSDYFDTSFYCWPSWEQTEKK